VLDAACWQTPIIGKSIILYGKDSLKIKWGLNYRPRLLVRDATPDLVNLSSRKLGKTCIWLDGDLSKNKPDTLRNAVNKAYGCETRAPTNMCMNAKGEHDFFTDYRQEAETRDARGTRWIGGKGFWDFLVQSVVH
jgi:hypothetical protein